MAVVKLGLAGMVLLGLAGCTTVAALPGTPEFAAAKVSRGYDCGLRVDRTGVLARLPPSERPRFLDASRGLAVKAYKAPRRCEASERQSVQRDLSALARK